MPDDIVVPAVPAVPPLVIERGDRETRASFRVSPGSSHGSSPSMQDSWCRTSTFDLRSR